MSEATELPPELAALEGVAAAADAAVQAGAELPQAPRPDPAASIEQGRELSAVLQLGVMTLTPALPFLPQCYTPEACDRIGYALAAVAEKRGWNLGQFMGPETALAVAVIPPTVAAVAIGKQYFAARRAAAAAPAGAGNVVPLPAREPAPDDGG